MSSPEPLPSPTPVGNIMVSFGAPQATAGNLASRALPPFPCAANEDLLPGARERPPAPGPQAPVPLSAWLSLAFWAIGTALLFILGLAYRLLA